ncbi:MAG: hypothetical protein ACJA0X_000749 [Cyclobacteriaceae bacterium]|jgi:hypothetical protein
MTTSSCNDDKDIATIGPGSVSVRFDNVVGEEEVSLVPYETSESFPFSNSVDQSFNIDILGYYITQIKLLGTGTTEDYIDQVVISAEGAEGVYHILENVETSQMINFENIPEGTYSRLEFTLGVPGELVEEGATGGVLDPSNGAWFWNWNAGYIAFMLEGNSASSGQEESDHFLFHVGGWGETNNIKQIGLDLPSNLNVSNGSTSMLYIKMDVLKAISGTSNVDFGTTFAVKSPAAGEPIAENLVEAFEIHHVQND